MNADEIVATLGLQPHPEGGWYAESWRGPAGPDGRAVATAIYFLLRTGERSHWHRVDADETWLFHAGAPLALTVVDDEANRVEHRLGPDVVAGERPQAVVPARAWQSAWSTGDWTLVSCVVAPGFEFTGFELANRGDAEHEFRWWPQREPSQEPEQLTLTVASF